MPKKTFLNLPKEKQKRLLDAAYKEFSKVPIDEASINAIVHDADISRGSFYQYFDDKDDLYSYCLDLLRENQSIQVENCFRDADGKLFIALFDVFDYFYQHFFKEEHQKFYHQLFCNLTYQRSKNFYKQKESKRPFALFERIAESIDYSDLVLESKSEAVELLKFFFEIMHGTISQVFSQNLSETKAYDLMRKKIMWLANGISKEKIKSTEETLL